MDLESIFRSFIIGLIMAIAAFAVMVGFNYATPFIAPLIEHYTGLSEPALLALVFLVFLVGFAATYRPQPEEEESFPLSHGGKGHSMAARKHVASFTNNAVLEEVELIEEAFVTHLRERTERLNDDARVVLKVQLRPKVELKRDTFLYYLEQLEKRFKNFKYVVFTDRFNKFLFYAKAKDFKKQIEPTAGTHIMDLINANRYEVLKMESFIYPQHISGQMNAQRALTLMADKDWDEVMVVTQGWAPRYVGVLELKYLLRMVLHDKKSGPPKRHLLKAPIPLLGDDSHTKEEKEKDSEKEAA